MKLKYCKRRKVYELAGSDTKFANMENFIVNHNGQKYYVPLVSPTDANASKLRVVRKGNVLSPLRYFDEAIDMLNGRTLADVQQIFQSGLGKYYFKAGDYFDIAFASSVKLQASGVINAGSKWRVVCLGIDHNADIEGYNRGHFCIGRTTDDIEIAFLGHEINAEKTNAGGWEKCGMRSWLNSTFYKGLPADLKAVITPCDKYTDNVAGETNAAANMSITRDNLWLMASVEAGLSPRNPAEATLLKRYDYYANGNSLMRIYHTDGSQGGMWWLRSPGGNAMQFKVIYANGVQHNRSVRYDATGVVPCFTIS